MAEKSQAYQAAQNEVEQIEKDKAAQRELAEHKSSQSGEESVEGFVRPDPEDQSGEDASDRHDREGLSNAAQENEQHPFRDEAVEDLEETERQRRRAAEQEQAHGDDVVETVDEYGETIGQPYGESDVHGDTTTPRLPESGHTEEEQSPRKPRDDEKEGEEDEQRGGVTGAI